MSQLVPHSPETEQAVLAAALMDPVALDVILDQLDPDDFHDHRNKEIFEAAYSMRSELVAVDEGSIRAELQRRNRLEAIGGLPYLANLVDNLVDVNALDTYIAYLREFRLLRELHATCSKAAAAAINGTKSDEVVARLNRRLRELEGRHLAEGLVELKGALREAQQDLAQRREGKRPGLLTGFHDLDSYLQGLEPGQLLLLAARPSIGKSALASGIATYTAIEKNQATAIFSMEMSRVSLVKRILAARCRVDHTKLRAGTLSPREQRLVEYAMKDIDDAPLWIDESRGIGMSHITARLRRLDRVKKLRLVVVDYLGLIKYESKHDRDDLNLGELSSGLKTLAGELKVPIIALHQLNRSSEKEKRRPTSADLRGSGNLEQDADTIVMLHEDPDQANVIEALITKQRDGARGIVRLHWTPEFVRFDNLEGTDTGGPTLWQ